MWSFNATCQFNCCKPRCSSAQGTKCSVLKTNQEYLPPHNWSEAFCCYFLVAQCTFYLQTIWSVLMALPITQLNGLITQLIFLISRLMCLSLSCRFVAILQKFTLFALIDTVLNQSTRVCARELHFISFRSFGCFSLISEIRFTACLTNCSCKDGTFYQNSHPPCFFHMHFHSNPVESTFCLKVTMNFEENFTFYSDPKTFCWELRDFT